MAGHTRDQEYFRYQHVIILKRRNDISIMPSSGCCVPGCTRRGGYNSPKDSKLRKQWILAVRRNKFANKHQLWEPTPHSIVCHAHFKETDFHSLNRFGKAPLRKQRRKDAVPSIFPWTQETRTDERGDRLEARKRQFPVDEEVDMVEEVEHVPDMVSEVHEVVIHPIEEDLTDTDMNMMNENINEGESVQKSCSSQTPKLPMFQIENISNNDEAMLFYTGLASYSDFRLVLHSLGDNVNHLRYLYSPVVNISIEDQFLITLIKLRLNKGNYELAFMFNTSTTTVTNIWVTWVNFMYWQWSEVPSWPDRDLVRFFCPSDFAAKFPKTRIIIDGTEMPIMKPKPPIGQQCTYSTYKNKNTVKVLVGATPGGLMSYLSPAYGGSASDRQIVERSALTVLCDRGDSIMADKGFNVQDMFALKDVTINLPTFFSKKNRMSTQTVMKDRKISSKRVHIERIIGLAKTFKILTSPLNSTETRLATEITSVCFMLCKFKKCIVPTSS